MKTRWAARIPKSLILWLLLPTPAHANGAFGMALSIFTWNWWLLYVTVTVVFEAWAMGRWSGLGWLRSLGRSLGANFVTAILGGIVSGIIGYFFLGIFGSVLNPNPIGQTVFVFTLFGIGSALIEALFWRRAAQAPNDSPFGYRKVCPRCIAVHLVGVPLGLLILLAPPRPYHGLEMQVAAQRQFYLATRVLKPALQHYVEDHRAIPAVHSVPELLELLRPQLGRFANDPGLWAAAYVPDYHRFDTSERRRGAEMEWNPAAAGIRVGEGRDRVLWLVRVRDNGAHDLLSVVLPAGIVY